MVSKATSKSIGIHQFSFWVAGAVLLLVAGMLAGCATAAATTPTSTQAAATQTATQVPTTPTATQASVQCGEQFSSDYQATLPDSTYTETTVYAQVPLPPQTRTRSDDASGHRVRLLCSAGTNESVLNFVHTHLTAQGWQPEAQSAGGTCDQSGPHFAQQQCWKHGSFELFVGLNSHTDWAMGYLDPGALCAGDHFTGTYDATLPNASSPQTMVYAQVQLPPQTQSYESDASGTRVHFLCSRTTEDVLTFLHAHLTQQGWQSEAQSAG